MATIANIRTDRLAFLPRLEALRGIAAVAVVGYHSRNDEVVTGMAPVVLFFVLSGFVLARSLQRDTAPLTFVRNRVFRLVPAAAASVLLLTILYWQFGFHVGFQTHFDPVNVLLNALMIRSDINGPMWSLTVECFATPLILASFLVHRRFGPRPLAILCVVLFGLSFWGGYVHLLGGVTNLAPLYAFVAGVCLHFAAQEGRTIPFPVISTLAAGTLLLACGLHKQTSPTILVEAVAASMLVYLVATENHSRLFSALDLPPIRFVGRISYSFYLLHMIGLAVAIAVAPNSSFTQFLVAVLVTLPLAWISWRCIEIPFLRWRATRRAENTRDFAAHKEAADALSESLKLLDDGHVLRSG
jgi:exopolysaccharide production protein ExoZ